MNAMLTTAEVLEFSAQLIERDGLGKDKLFTESTGCYCTLGALRLFVPDVHAWQAAADAVRIEIANLLGTRIFLEEYRSAVGVWNDQPERTATEVVDVLRRSPGRCQVMSTLPESWTAEQVETVTEDGRTYIVGTEHSTYEIDTAAHLIIRTNRLNNNPREHDDVPRTYDHLAADIDAPLVIHYTSYGWVTSTKAVSIHAIIEGVPA
jgi:hypothetical protein